MSEPFVGEIRLVSFAFPPKGWAFCAGQLLPINQNQALFSLLGTTYGGNGTTNFALPDLRSRVPLHQGAGYVLGQQGGVESVSLTAAQVPHVHTRPASSAAPTTEAPASSAAPTVPAAGGAYDGVANAAMAPTGAGGGGQPHPNVQPYLTLNYVIALQGIFPSRN